MTFLRPAETNSLTLPLIMLIVPLSSAHVSSVAPFINEMSQDMEVPLGLVGQLGTAQFIGAFVSAISLAPFIGQMQLRSVLFASALILAIASVLTASVLSFPVMFAARIVAGLAAGVALAGGLAAVGRAWPDPEERSSKTGFVFAAVAGGPGIMAPGVRLIAEPASWQTAIAAYGVFAAAIGLLALLALPALKGTPSQAGVSLKSRLAESSRVLTLPVVGSLISLRVLLWITLIATVSYIPGFFIAEYPGREAWIGPIYAIFSLGGLMLGSMAYSMLLSRMGSPARVMKAAGITFLAAGAAYVWMTTGPAITTALLLVWAFGLGIYLPGIVSLLYTYSGRRQGAAIFADGALQQAAAIMGTAIGGLAIAIAPGFVGWQAFITVAIALTLVPLTLVLRSVRSGATLPA